MKFATALLFSLLWLGCKEAKQIKGTTQKIPAVSAPILSPAKECLQHDTITSSGTKIHYKYRDNKFQIEWSDNNYKRAYDSLFSCDYDPATGLWDFVPKLKSETDNHLVLTNIIWTSSGGNPAPLEYGALILPKNGTDTAYRKDFCIDTKGNYLVYGDDDNETVHIQNIETGKIQNILLVPKPALSRSPTLSIRKADINNGSLYIKYDADDKDNHLHIIEKRFKLAL